MIKFPYGMADFRQIITQGYYYRDRTGAIPDLEQAKSQLFIRPRRFGKSLLLSMLENYYDVARTDQFETLFGTLDIGQAPTAARNGYFILRWDFSCVDPAGTAGDVKRALHNHVNSRIENCLRYYRDNGFSLSGVRVNDDDALHTIDSLAGAAARAGRPIYLLIDEYDNFANTVMMLPASDATERYKALVHDEGVMRTLMKAVKSATGGDMIDRVFITGVSPVVMSDITSGHNIAEDIFFAPEFGTLCGFVEGEIRQTLEEIVQHCGLDAEKAAEAHSMMRTFYNGYSFVPRSMSVVYNPTLCLHFFNHFQKRCTYPDEMLDANLAVDESKLAYTAAIPGGSEMVFALSERDAAVRLQHVSKRFGLSDMLGDAAKDRRFLASFLYYFGVLTLGGETDDLQLILKVPNLVMQSLYVNRVQRMLLPDPVIRDQGRDAAGLVYRTGDIAPLCRYVAEHLFSTLKNRDYAHADEFSIKTCFLTLLYNDTLYIMDAEPEIGRRYADLTMIIRPDMRRGKIFDVLIEFKYLSLKALGMSGEQVASLSETSARALPAVVRALDQGRGQVIDYTRRLKRKYGDLRLKGFVVVALGFEKICCLNVDEVADLPSVPKPDDRVGGG